MFKNSNNVFEVQLRELFKPAQQKEDMTLFQLISLVFYHNANITDLYDMYNLLGIESFIKLVHLMDGKNIRFPTSQELRDAIVVAICYYHKEVEGLNWDQIREKIPFEFSSISIAHKIKNINTILKRELEEIFKSNAQWQQNRTVEPVDPPSEGEKEDDTHPTS